MQRFRLLMAVVAAAAVLSIGSSAAADCAGPEVSASPAEVSPGDELSIVGSGWGDACNDTGRPGCDPPPLGDPIQDIRLQLRDRQTSETYDLVTVNAGEEYDFSVSVAVPDVPAGAYEIVDARDEGDFSGRPLRVGAD